MRSGVACVAFFVAQIGAAQLEVPVRIIMDGAQAQDRQVIGLADPVGRDAAVSVDALRAGSVSFVHVTGTEALVGDLFPTPLAYTAGMAITIVPTDANDANAQLDLNSLGQRQIVKWGQLPLDSADLTPGLAVRLVYDGTKFLLLSNSYRPCPSGFSSVSGTSCISDSVVSIGTLLEAASACEALGARLCSVGEWIGACRNSPGFLGTLSALEWVDDGANNAADGKVVGTGSSGVAAVTTFACEYGGSSVTTIPRAYRCCFTR